jgi:hypothetical protein
LTNKEASIRVGSHQVRDLGLLVEPGEVLGPLKAPPSRPAFPRRVAIERGDEVDEQFSHGHLLISGAFVAAAATRLDGRRVEKLIASRPRVGVTAADR